MTIPRDKLLHSAVGACIAVIAQALLWLLLGLLIPGVGIVLAYIAGDWKEDRDAGANRDADAAGLPQPHSVEVADRNATALGGMVVDAVATWILIFALHA
jgi:hypothetical protein